MTTLSTRTLPTSSVARALTPAAKWARAVDLARTPGSAILRNWSAARVQTSARGGRAYAGAMMSRTTSDWVALSTSADAELHTSLRTLRNRTRELCRNNEYAKQALRLIVNNVVGQAGIGMQSNVMMRRGGKPDDRANDAIETAFAKWGRKENCHTAGKLSWTAIQRVCLRAVAEGGEILLRKIRGEKFGRSDVPFALEIIEPDQLVDSWSGRNSVSGNEVRMGVEVDKWQRPVAYWLYPRHPGDVLQQGVPQANDYIRVPAEEVIHLAVWDRPNQSRGVPWFHAVMVKLRHMGGYEEAEIVAARASAAIMGFITTSEPDLGVDGDDDPEADGLVDGERVMDMAPGTIRELQPGETFTGFAPSRPNSALEPFMRFMLRAVAVGVGCAYEGISGDYSQSNYSSSRLSLLNERDNWRVLQAWLVEDLMQPVYEAWLEMAVLSGAVDLRAYEMAPEVYHAPRWQPRGWEWVDPAKEGAAWKAAVRNGFATVADVIAAKGGDIEDVWRQRRRELDMSNEMKLVFDTDPNEVTDKGQAQPEPADTTGDANAAGDQASEDVPNDSGGQAAPGAAPNE